MFKWFEKRVDPYPEEGLNQPLPTTFFPFVWQAAKGVRGYLLILVLLGLPALKLCFMPKLVT
jgi:ATP-binding cassette subfamily B multidrug efflux pump